jgi:hypothetical protein
VIWKPVLVGGPIDATKCADVLNHALAAGREGLPPNTIKVREMRPIDFYDLSSGTPWPDPLCVYRLKSVAGATAFYEFAGYE